MHFNSRMLLLLSLLIALTPTVLFAQSDYTCDCSYNAYNCADFSDFTEAQSCFWYCGEQGVGDIHQMDLNEDGLACTESDITLANPTRSVVPTVTSAPDMSPDVDSEPTSESEGTAAVFVIVAMILVATGIIRRRRRRARTVTRITSAVTNANYVDISNATDRSFQLVCPKCEKTDIYLCDLSRDFRIITCTSCHREFNNRIVKVRAKNSRVSSRTKIRSGRNYVRSLRRSFSVRVYCVTGQEDLIEFDNAFEEDFELRARDMAAFNYFKGKLKIVQNLTINRYMKISKPRCYLATMVYGADSYEVAILCDFRDRVLLKYSTLTVLVRIYYRISPWLVEKLGTFNAFHSMIRILLAPIVFILSSRSKYSVEKTLL